MTTKKQRERDEARAELLKLLKPGDTIYSIVRIVSRSGMSRTIDFYKLTDDGPRWLTYWIGKLTDHRQDKRGALKVTGCGMDMCFHVVYTVGRYLWPEGTPTPHGWRNGKSDADGGYALRSETLAHA